MTVNACGGSPIFLPHSHEMFLTAAQLKRIQAMQISLAIGRDGMDSDVWDDLISEIYTFLQGFTGHRREHLKNRYFRDLPDKC